MFLMFAALLHVPARAELDVVAIIDAQAGAVKRCAYLYLKDEKQAEDICQEVFLRLWQSPPHAEDERSLRAWLLRVAINACRDYLRTPWHRRVSASAEDYVFDRETRPSDNPEGVAAGHERDEQLYKAVMALPVKYREPIILHYYFDFSQQETARMLSLSDTALRSRLMRARNLLRTALGGEVEM